MVHFATNIAKSIENIVVSNKKYHLMGAFLLDKEVRSKFFFIFF